MSQVIPIGICKLTDNNEEEVENTVKIIEKRKAKIQSQISLLKSEVDNLSHKNVLLDKQTICTQSLCQKLEMEIGELKSKTEDAATCLESTNWKLYKASLLKEFENETNEYIAKQKFKYDKLVDHKTHTYSFDNPPSVNSHKNQCNANSDLKILKHKAEELIKEIEDKKEAKKNADPNLHRDVQMLEKRNAALIVRYQRQVQETESRNRQSLTQLNSLKKLLAEKNALFSS